MVQAATETNTVSHAKVNLYVRNKATYFEAMGRAGYKMPSKHSRLCTLDFMMGVRSGVFYCPTVADCKSLKQCYSMPPTEILMEKLNTALRP